MGDVGVPRLSAELRLDLDHIRGGLVFGVDRSHIKDAIAAMDRVEAELVVVRERAERLEQALREARPYVLGITHEQQPWRAETARGVLGRVDAVLAEQEKEQP